LPRPVGAAASEVPPTGAAGGCGAAGACVAGCFTAEAATGVGADRSPARCTTNVSGALAAPDGGTGYWGTPAELLADAAATPPNAGPADAGVPTGSLAAWLLLPAAAAAACSDEVDVDDACDCGAAADIITTVELLGVAVEPTRHRSCPTSFSAAPPRPLLCRVALAGAASVAGGGGGSVADGADPPPTCPARNMELCDNPKGLGADCFGPTPTRSGLLPAAGFGGVAARARRRPAGPGLGPSVPAAAGSLIAVARIKRALRGDSRVSRDLARAYIITGAYLHNATALTCSLSRNGRSACGRRVDPGLSEQHPVHVLLALATVS
jgi:hypothetical protein